MNFKKFFTFFLVAIFLYNSTFSVFAQEDLYAESGEGYENYTGESSNADDVNIYLQDNSPKPVDTTVKTPAQVANGTLAGNYNTRLSCPYNFERDIYAGVKGEDVRLLQVILNSDKRTLIAYDGPGSAGNETTIFGTATKDAVKRFQALFIEYIGIANGRFGPRTRTVMNAVCNGTASTASNQSYGNVQTIQNSPANINQTQVQNTQTSSESIPPRVSLSANLNAVQRGDYFKVIVNLSEEIQKFTPESVIVDGGTVKEIRKLSKVSYVMSITPNDDARVVVVQIEADTLQDLVGNKNEFASNEVNVRVLTPVVPGAATTSDPNSLNGLLDKIISSAPQCTYNTTGQLITGANINTTGCATTASGNTGTYDCYGQKIPNTQQCPYDPYRAQQQQQAQQQANQQAQQAGQGLGALLGKLLGGGGGGSGGGDKNGQQQNNNTTTPNPTPNPNPVPNPNPNPAPEKTQAEKDKASLDALLKDCKDAKSSECQLLQAKADSAKSGEKELDKVVRQIPQCKNDKAPLFCISEGDTVYTYNGSDIKIIMSKGSVNYLIFAKNVKQEGMAADACLLQQPSIVPDKYNKVFLKGCVAKESECVKGSTKIQDPVSPLKKEAAIYIWKNESKLSASYGPTCSNPPTTSGDAKVPISF